MLTSGPFLIRSVDTNYLIKIQIKRAEVEREDSYS